MNILELKNGQKATVGTILQHGITKELCCIFAIKGDKLLTTFKDFDEIKDVEIHQKKECMWYIYTAFRNYKVYSQPILGQDENGEDVRFDEEIMYYYIKRKILGNIINDKSKTLLISSNTSKGWTTAHSWEIEKIKTKESKVSKYTMKSQEVKAAQLIIGNNIGIVSLLGRPIPCVMNIDNEKCYSLDISGLPGRQTIHIGDYVVKNPKGDIFIMTEQDFKDCYEQTGKSKQGDK